MVYQLKQRDSCVKSYRLSWYGLLAKTADRIARLIKKLESAIFGLQARVSLLEGLLAEIGL